MKLILIYYRCHKPIPKHSMRFMYKCITFKKIVNYVLPQVMRCVRLKQMNVGKAFLANLHFIYNAKLHFSL